MNQLETKIAMQLGALQLQIAKDMVNIEALSDEVTRLRPLVDEIAKLKADLTRLKADVLDALPQTAKESEDA